MISDFVSKATIMIDESPSLFNKRVFMFKFLLEMLHSVKISY